ncbi:MAG: hypothetical protein WA741_30165, partial [Candidatus Sulfotelmatobacter sp.]
LKSRKDDMLTIAEIGVDQLIVDEMQEFSYAKDAIMNSSLPRQGWSASATGDLAGSELHITQRVWRNCINASGGLYRGIPV